MPYEIGEGYEDTDNKRGKPRHLAIKDLWCFCLEEIDFSQGHKQDNRSWSQSKNAKNNGRLQITEKFRQEHKLRENKISYQNTVRMLKDIYDKNKSKEQE